jgi:hypothetical protein
MLVNLFAGAYDPDKADRDAGIPYVSEPEKVFIRQYERATIEEVYEKIEDDILDGLKLVNDSYYAASGKYHFTRNAALALASRFFLFKGDFEKCEKYSSQMLTANPEPFIRDIRMLLETATSEGFTIAYTSPTEPGNLLLIRQVTNFPVNYGYWPNEDLLGEIYSRNPWNATDIRNANEYPKYLRGNGLAIAKYQFFFERSSLTSNVGLNYTIMPAFRAEEVLLNRAEANVYLNNMSEVGDDLLLLISKRYYDSDHTDDPLIPILQGHYQESNGRLAALYFIIEERRKEFLSEGLRWFDIKRFGMPVTHLLGDNSVITLKANDDRKVLQIPQAAIDIGGLEPNPR